MDEDSKKALGYLRECRDKTEKSREFLISGQYDINRALLHMERSSHRTDRNSDELEDESDKLKTSLTGLYALAAELDKLHVKLDMNVRVQKRPEKGRKADSGIGSVDSTLLPCGEEDNQSSMVQPSSARYPHYSASDQPHSNLHRPFSFPTSTDEGQRLDILKSTNVNESTYDEPEKGFSAFSQGFQEGEISLLNAQARSSNRRQQTEPDNRAADCDNLRKTESDA